jgi:hypothetical protein
MTGICEGWKLQAVALASALALAACVQGKPPGPGGARGGPSAEEAEPNPDGCLLPSQRRMVVIEMFFGRDLPGRFPVRDVEWADFVARQVAPRFPDGFTVFDATGQWLSPTHKRVAHEATKVVRIVVPGDGPDLPKRVRDVGAMYKSRFRQESVGVTTEEACAVF